MEKNSKLALARQLLEAAENNLKQVKQILLNISGDSEIPKQKTETNTKETGEIIEGFFDGQNMVGPNDKLYPVPANYASKSKLVQGDKLKLTVLKDGSFIYKQIGPAERKKLIGELTEDEKGEFLVQARGKVYKVLKASVTYFKGEAGDQVTLIISKDKEASWATIENVIRV